jgi:hypothetical protein
LPQDEEFYRFVVYLLLMENIFELSLNEQGKKYLNRLLFWTKLLYGGCFLTFVFDTINAYLLYKDYIKYVNSYPSDFVRVQVLISTVFLFVYGVLLLIQSHFFYTFSKRSNRAMEYQSTADFNSSFNSLLKHCIVAAILFLINALWAMSYTYLAFRMNG